MVKGLFTSGNSQIERTFFLVNIINNMCSVILFFHVLCSFVFPGVLSFSWPFRHFYFPPIVNVVIEQCKEFVIKELAVVL